MQQQDFSAETGKHPVKIQIPQIRDVISAHAHPSAEQVNLLRHRLLVRIPVNAMIAPGRQCRVQQHHSGNVLRMTTGRNNSHQSALALAHQEDLFPVHKLPALRLFKHRFQVIRLRQHGHFRIGSIAPVWHAGCTAAAEIECIDGNPFFGQALCIAGTGFMVIPQPVGKDDQRTAALRLGNMGHSVDPLIPLLYPDFLGSEISIIRSLCKPCTDHPDNKQGCQEHKSHLSHFRYSLKKPSSLSNGMIST